MHKVNELTILDVIRIRYNRTLLPELVEIFGLELTERLADIFGGMKIFIPSKHKLDEIKQDLEIFNEMCYCNSETVIDSLAKRYKIAPSRILNTYRSMRLLAVKHFNLAEEGKIVTDAIATVGREPNATKRKTVNVD